MIFLITTELIEEVPFSITARVAMQLGRESISNSIVAILELVKNAYDADAERVRIRFAHLGTPGAVMVIEDDGLGMSEAQLKRNWLLIGTQYKRKSTASRSKGRTVTGEKGLGRLGLDRLCATTFLRSFTSGASKGIELRIHWQKYEKHSNNKLDEIKHQLYRIDKRISDPVTGETVHYQIGTQIVLQGLKDGWTKEQIVELRNELILLISPFAGINDFRVEVSTDGQWPELEGLVSSAELLDAAEWHVEAEILNDRGGLVRYEMHSPRFNETFSDPPKPWRERFSDRGSSPRCGPLKLEFFFFPRERTELKDLNLTKSQIETFLNSNQGIRIYRDSFRVKPYGQPNGEGDWLNLSYRRMQSPAGVRDDIGTWRVGYNQVVGAVFISREKNEKLIDQTNREGIVEGDAYYDLRTFAKRAIEFFEIKRQEFEKKSESQDEFEVAKQRAQRASEESQIALQGLKSSVDTVKELLTGAEETGKQPEIKRIETLLTAAVSQVATTVEQSRATQEHLKEAAKQQAERLQRQKDTLGNLASLGILTASFGHETLGSANLVRNNAALLKADLESSLADINASTHAQIKDELVILLDHSERIETFARFTLANVRRDKRKRKLLRLDKLIASVFSYFQKPMEDKSVEVQLDLAGNIPSFMAFEIDWESILINLISNAVWALEDTLADKRKIRVRLRAGANEKKLELFFADSGKGLEVGTSDKIFLPTFSTKRNERGDVIGTGMGLSIVRGFVEDYPLGIIDVKSPCDIGGAEFHIQIGITETSRRGGITREG